jgi:hypothetical protein
MGYSSSKVYPLANSFYLDRTNSHFPPIGRERYIQILKNFSELEGRTLSEIREESRRMCDKYEPLIRDELRTPEGREPWRWLLSVWDQAS